LLLNGRQHNDVRPKVSKRDISATKEKDALVEADTSKAAPVGVQSETIERAVEDRGDSEPEQADVFIEDAADVEMKTIEAQELTVDWQAASEHPPLVTSQLSDEQKQAINEAPVPVLLPDNPQLLGNAVLTNGEYYYAASMSEDDVTILVNGAARIMRVKEMDYPEPPVYGDSELPVNRANGIVEINFRAFGIYYDVVVECDDHQNDTRCTDDHFALELVDSLRLAQAE
jgi:hypothetical protein